MQVELLKRGYIRERARESCLIVTLILCQCRLARRSIAPKTAEFRFSNPTWCPSTPHEEHPVQRNTLPYQRETDRGDFLSAERSRPFHFVVVAYQMYQDLPASAGAAPAQAAAAAVAGVALRTVSVDAVDADDVFVVAFPAETNPALAAAA